jgi:hypothetical protein
VVLGRRRSRTLEALECLVGSPYIEALLLDQAAEILLVQAHAPRASTVRCNCKSVNEGGISSNTTALSTRRRHRVGALISGVHARKIKKNTRLQLLRVEAMLHQIADTYDPLQLVVLDNRQMTDPR